MNEILVSRSCKFCRWMFEQDTFVGIRQWCELKSKVTTLGGYCGNFKEKKK